ncbi:MAG: type IV pili twitching motility protein PilT [Gallionellales bacterium RIFCSPLOWO2_12_FULL_59_22]|nr:MAG: type IV pili twitching motility protein PilT [Gallionellales bacterium RIFCSPLOWO2_02_FULL_59_110]OGT13109.1 MAG: type IV pili twitching motility protein PilT [Gallionellales bacterium RIFCSPLOWO2_12_FULL_59_22]
MEQQERLQYQTIMHKMLAAMMAMKGSDLFLTADYPPAVKLNGKLTKLNETPLTAEQTRKIAHSISTEKQWHQYSESKGANFAIAPEGIGRFRINIFTQQQRTGIVARVITTEIPDFDKMNLPPILKSVVMEKRGLVLLVGGTGSGKSTTLAAMLGVRNRDSHGHIISIEDPVEYVHTHQNCIITHREVGIDTVGWFDALKDTLRQAPDVILIGEIRDHETMEYALNFAETGHLCMATLHANSANQAIDRIVNFFPIEKREQVLNDLSLNMRAIISQRLVRKISGGRAAAIEILLSTASSRDAIAKGEVGALKEIMKKSVEQGMKTFDQCLYELYEKGDISLHELQVNADAKGDLMLRLKLECARFRQEEMGGDAGSQIAGLSFDGQDEMEAARKKAADEAAGVVAQAASAAPAGVAGSSPAAKPELKMT